MQRRLIAAVTMDKYEYSGENDEGSELLLIALRRLGMSSSCDSVFVSEKHLMFDGV